MNTLNSDTGAESYEPKLTVKDGYLHVAIPLAAVALARADTSGRVRLTVDLSDTLTDCEIMPDLIFASGLCLFSDERKELEARDQTFPLNPQEFSIMRALAKQVGGTVETEELLAAMYGKYSTETPVRKSQRFALKSRISAVRRRVAQAEPILGDLHTGIIQAEKGVGYKMTDEL